jgi:tetratricopeptide (TPR) repeat protein
VRGTAYDSKDDYDHAIADYTKAIELSPDDADAFRSRGLVYNEKDDYEHALADFNKSIAIDPRQVKSYSGRGESYNGLSKYDEAIADYTKAIALDPKDDDAYNRRGWTYKNKHDYDRAIADFTKAIELNPTRALYFKNRAETHGNLKDYNRAIADLTKAIELNPQYATAYSDRGYYYTETVDFDRAIADLNKAIELNPQKAWFYNNRAWVYFKAGKPAQGLPDVERSLELNPKDAGAIGTRAHIYEAMGRKDEAIVEYRRALAIKPDLKESAEGLARLTSGTPESTAARLDANRLSDIAKSIEKPKLQDRLAPDRSSNPGSIAPSAVQQPVHFIEEDPKNPQGKQYAGQVTWRTIQIGGGASGPKDVQIRGDIDIPDLKLKLTLIINRNLDTSLPASHTIEMTFMLPPGFSNGSVEKVPGVMMKSNELSREEPLAGLAVKVTDGFFLVGLSTVVADRIRNLQLLKERSWLYIPLDYANNNRATIAIPKNAEGDRAFNDVFGAWERAAGGGPTR